MSTRACFLVTDRPPVGATGERQAVFRVAQGPRELPTPDRGPVCLPWPRQLIEDCRVALEDLQAVRHVLTEWPEALPLATRLLMTLRGPLRLGGALPWTQNTREPAHIGLDLVQAPELEALPFESMGAKPKYLALTRGVEFVRYPVPVRNGRGPVGYRDRPHLLLVVGDLLQERGREVDSVVGVFLRKLVAFLEGGDAGWFVHIAIPECYEHLVPEGFLSSRLHRLDSNTLIALLEGTASGLGTSPDLKERGFHVVQFVGHSNALPGDGEASAIRVPSPVGGDGDFEDLSWARIGAALCGPESNTRVVVLGNCRVGRAAAEAFLGDGAGSPGVDHLIGMIGYVHPDAVERFCMGFYYELLHGSIAGAVAWGRRWIHDPAAARSRLLRPDGSTASPQAGGAPEQAPGAIGGQWWMPVLWSAVEERSPLVPRAHAPVRRLMDACRSRLNRVLRRSWSPVSLERVSIPLELRFRDRGRSAAGSLLEQGRAGSNELFEEEDFDLESVVRGQIPLPEGEGVGRPHWVLLGQPGSGKSTLLAQVADLLARDAELEILPIWVEVGAKGDVGRWIQGQGLVDVLRAAHPNLGGDEEGLVREVRRRAEQGAVVLLIDGLDEAGEHGRNQVDGLLESLVGDFAGVVVVVASRTQEYTPLTSPVTQIEIQPLGSQQKSRYLDRWRRWTQPSEPPKERMQVVRDAVRFLHEAAGEDAELDPTGTPLVLSRITPMLVGLRGDGSLPGSLPGARQELSDLGRHHLLDVVVRDLLTAEYRSRKADPLLLDLLDRESIDQQLFEDGIQLWENRMVWILGYLAHRLQCSGLESVELATWSGWLRELGLPEKGTSREGLAWSSLDDAMSLRLLAWVTSVQDEVGPDPVQQALEIHRRLTADPGAYGARGAPVQGREEWFLNRVRRASELIAPIDPANPRGPWEFLHRSFRENLAAQYLAMGGAQAMRVRWEALAQGGSGVSRWLETFSLAAGWLPQQQVRPWREFLLGVARDETAPGIEEG